MILKVETCTNKMFIFWIAQCNNKQDYEQFREPTLAYKMYKSVVVTLIKLCKHFVNIFLAIKSWGYPALLLDLCLRPPTPEAPQWVLQKVEQHRRIKTYFHVLIIFPYRFFSCQNKIKVDFFPVSKVPILSFQIVGCRRISCSRLIRENVWRRSKKIFWCDV